MPVWQNTSEKTVQHAGAGSVYFTCETKGGFTSELFQIKKLYEYGRYLGFHYLHTPLDGSRSSENVH